MKDFHGFGLRGPISIFVNNFIKHRSYKGRVGPTFSYSHPQEMGVPQGSLLSVTLILVKINSISQLVRGPM